MKPAPFAYLQPDSMAAVLDALQNHADATIIAGGQSLLPMLHLRVTAAEMLIGISRIGELKGVTEDGAKVSIGALVTHAAIEDGLCREAVRGLLQRVAAKIAYRAVRNIGTIGGSLSLNDPSADWPACMLALGASMVVTSAGSGERRILIEEFLVDAYETALQPGDLLTRIDIPKMDDAGWGVSKVTRKSGAFADSLAVVVLGHGDRPSRVALTGTAGCARLLWRTAALLDEAPRSDQGRLKKAIMEDVGEAHEDATAYQQRCHAHTISSAIEEARSWSN